MTNLTLFRSVIFCLVFIVMPMLICAQTQPAAPAAPAAPSAPAKPAEPAQTVKPTPEAKPGDVDTVEHLLAAGCWLLAVRTWYLEFVLTSNCFSFAFIRVDSRLICFFPRVR